MFLKRKFLLSLGMLLKQIRMKMLKILLLSLVMLSGGALIAQENNIKKELKKKGDLIEATFYYESGEVAQKGFYKNGKLHGEWIAFDQNGNKKAIGKYAAGIKTGKWFFWDGDLLSEVDFQENRIASVNKWKIEKGLVSN